MRLFPGSLLWRTLMGRFVAATQRRIEAEQRVGKAAPAHAEATAFALCWMTERTFYQQLVQDIGGTPAP